MWERNKINVHICLYIKKMQKNIKLAALVVCWGVGNWVDPARVGRKFALFTFLYF